MRVLFIGDVVGRPGIGAVAALLPQLRYDHRIDVVLANGENMAGGRGLSLSCIHEIRAAGVDVITSGNHVWDQREMLQHIDREEGVLRPLNFAPGVPGRGYMVCRGALVLNLIGRLFMPPVDCPFRAADRFLESLEWRGSVRIVDFHGEATSEKVALAWYLDGRVSAVIGTHTHVATADARILPRGTAAVTDVGMVGPQHSVIGLKVGPAVDKFVRGLPSKTEVGDGPVIFNSVLLDVDEISGRAVSIERLDRILDLDGE